MSQDDYIDFMEVLDKRERYYDYFDTVHKSSNGEVSIVRHHCDYLPGNPPYRLSIGIDEDIPLSAFTPDSRNHAERIAAKLEGGDKLHVHGKTFEYYGEAPGKGKAALINPPEYVARYDRDLIWMQADGQVVIVRKGRLLLPLPRGEVLIRVLPEEIILLEKLTDRSRRRVEKFAAALEGNDEKIWGKSLCYFKWSDAQSRKKNVANYLVELRDET